MPSAKSDERIKAEQIFRESHGSVKLVEIAERLGVSPSKVRKWKSLDGWDKKDAPATSAKKKQVERSTRDKGNAPPKNAPKKKRGAPPGSQNAKGHGAPAGNANAAVTGAYMKIYGDLLSDDEKEIVADILDQGGQRRISLLQLLASLRIRERRLLKDINDIRGGAEMLTRHTFSHIEPSGKKAEDGREITKVVKINQEQETRRDTVQRFEESLTRVQAEIRRTEDSLRQLDEAEAKHVTKDNNVSLLDAMAEAFAKRGGGGPDE